MDMEDLSILDASEPLSRAVNEISKTGMPVAITKDGKYVGIIDERAIRQHISDVSKEKCGHVAERAPTLAPDATIIDACQAFFSGRFKAIPVISAGKVQGAISRRTLLRELLTEKMLSKKRVSEAMTSPVATMDIASSVGQARSELRKHNIRRLVVTNKGKIAGLLSVFDLADFVTSRKQSNVFNRGGERTSMDSQPIASYMKKQVETIAQTDSLASAVKKMIENSVAALVVVDGGYPQGIVTAKDVMHSALAEEKTARVFVSGLSYDQREFADEIVREGEKMFGKLGKNFEASTLAVHIKSEGSGFAIRARLGGNKKSYNASAADFRIEVALGKVIKELKSEAARDKDNHYRKVDVKSESEE
ncbi:MAG: CBS domain-containing protein [Candidatus Micrarchaeota archaeon]|nr:CBS domain-containing protein [Candidatus Micrarchaeota archaeon]